MQARQSTLSNASIETSIVIMSPTSSYCGTERDNMQQTSPGFEPMSQQEHHGIEIKLELHETKDARIVLKFPYVQSEGCRGVNNYRKDEYCLWTKTASEPPRDKKYPYMYHCLLCGKTLGRFETLTSHLNIHFKRFPHKCSSCLCEYPSKKSLDRHKKKCGHRGN